MSRRFQHTSTVPVTAASHQLCEPWRGVGVDRTNGRERLYLHCSSLWHRASAGSWPASRLQLQGREGAAPAGDSPGKSPGAKRISMPETKYVFKASRWTSGNRFFPVRIEITSDHVVRVKPRLLGASEESIPISKVASVSISTGLIWADILIESSGGTDPITSHGHRKDDARRIRQIIEQLQQGK